MSNKLEKLLVEIIRYSSIFILLIPFLNDKIYSETLSSILFPKVIFFQTIAALCFALWAFLAIESKKYRPNIKNPLFLSLTLFTAILIITSFTGVDAYRSFWSLTGRMTGVITMIHFYLWFLVLISVFKTKKDWKKFLLASLACSLLVGLYAIWQKVTYVGISTSPRVSSSLGNPIYLSVYAMMHVFLALYLFFPKKQKIFIVLAIFNLFIVFLGASRGVILSLLIVFFLSIFISFKRKILIVIAILLLLLSGLFLYSQREKEWMDDYVEIKRIANPEIHRGNIQGRLETWHIAWEGFKERPIRGWGWENYNYVFEDNYRPHFIDHGRVATWFDKSHNQLLDVLCLTGIFGFLSYLSIFISALYLLRKKSLILSLMLVAYFLQNLFVFDVPTSLIVLYLSFGLSYSISEKEIKEEIVSETTSKKGAISFLLILIITSFAVYKTSLYPLTESHFIYKTHFVINENLGQGVLLYEKILNEKSFINREGRLNLAFFLESKKDEADKILLISGYQLAIKEMKKSVEEHPLNVRYYLHLGKIKNSASFFDENYLQKAENVLKEAMELSPRRQELYYELARTKTLQGKKEEAIEIIKEAIRLDESVQESYWVLAENYIKQGEIEKGLETVEKALEITPKSVKKESAFIKAAFYYAKTGDYNKAVDLSQKAIEIKPNNVIFLSYKIVYLLEAGREEEALILLENNPQINLEEALTK